MKCVKSIAILLSGILTGLSLVSCEEEPKYFSRGTTRAEVYEIMGSPANTDNKLVAVWCCNGVAPKETTWREIFDNHSVIFAAFDSSGRTVNYTINSDQTFGLYPSIMSDEEVVDYFIEKLPP